MEAARQMQPCSRKGVFGVTQIIQELLLSKQNANRTARYTRSLADYLNQFAKGRESLPIEAIGVTEIEAWLARYSSPWTKQTWLNRISTLFAFAVRRGYVAANPCDRLERITIELSPPTILTPEQAQLLLKTCPTVCKPFLVLGMFAGIRPEEIMRMNWTDINLESGTAMVHGKTRRRRLVTLEPIALRLLREHPLKSGPVTPSLVTLKRWRRKARAVLGFDSWPQDVLRHTAASYLLALHQDAAKVALQLGNSVKILMSHYHEPVAAAAAENFFGVEGRTLSHVGGRDAGGAVAHYAANAKADGLHQLQDHAQSESQSEDGGEKKRMDGKPLYGNRL